MNIYQRINEVRKKIDYIKKEKAVQNYKAVTHDQVTALVRDHLIAAGVVIYPSLESSITIDTGEKTSKGTPIIRVEAVYKFTFINIEDGDYFVASVSAHANDQGDKAPGKALSYAKKAVILKVFEIESGEDDESRYESEPSGLSVRDRDDILKTFDDAQTLEELANAYLKAQAAAKEASDRVFLRVIVEEKDKRKAALSVSP